MKLETFFEKFDQFAAAPDAVAKMRELVLHLAVTGNLVRQNSTEQPAEDLLVQVRQSRDALVKEGTIRRIEALPPLTIDDVPFECPAGWAWVRFGEISSSFRGHNPPKSLFKDKPAPGYVRFIQQRDFRTDDYAVYVPESRHLKLVKKGEIVMAAYGNIGNTCRTVEGAFNVAIAKVMEIPPVARDYTDLLIRSDFIRGALEKVSSRVAVSSMSSDHMRSLAVPLPPLAEQKRIVAKVDELMALCDRLEAQQQERATKHAALARASLARFADAPIVSNLKFLFHESYSIPPADLRKSILTLAVQGKLVPQDPNDEPAEELVTRVAREKLRLLQAKEIKSETPLEPISDEEVFSIPDSWIWLRAGDLCRPISSGSTPDQCVFHASEGIPYLKVYNIRNQTVDFDYKRQFIAANHHKERMKRSILRPGDVIMNIVGPPLGKVAIVPDTFPEWNCNQAISFFRPIFPEFGPYLYTFLKEGSFLQNIQLIGTAGQDNISVTKCKFIPVSIPPLAEQRRIVAKVEQLMALVDALETQLAASRATGENLLSALIAELAGPMQGN
jgi:type I restriction enzyme S subunit